MSATQVIPTSTAAHALCAWCRAQGLDAATLLDPPPGQPTARLWREGDRFWWTVPTAVGREVVVLVARP